MKKKNLLFVFLVSFSILLSAVEKTAITAESRTVAFVTSTLLMKHHYEKREISKENSLEFFNAYLKILDPMHLYFTTAQVEQWKNSAGNLLVELNKGDISFGFMLYSAWMDRLREYESFVKQLDFTSLKLDGNDVFDADRTKCGWPASERELRRLWVARIKNELITLRLLDKIEEEEASKAKEEPSKGKWKRKSPEERIRKRISTFVKNNEKLEQIEVLSLYLNAFAAVFDPHTAYMPPKMEEDFNMSMSLSLSGIGAVLSSSEDGYTKVVEIMPGGPADRDGRLKAGDRIIAVAQEKQEKVDIVDMNLTKVVSMIRGKIGTKVTLTVLDGRMGAASAPKNIELTRDKVLIKESEARKEVKTVSCSDGKNRRIGIIVLPSFYVDFQAYANGDENYKSSTRDVKRLIGEFQKEGGIDALVMDLRSNGGGSLAEAVTMTGLFIPDGPVVQVRNADGRVHVELDEDNGECVYNGPMLVLTNRLSASASEIFAAAIQDYHRGIVAGDAKTHGKGSVQTVQELKNFLKFIGIRHDTGMLKFTTSKFYRINGGSTQLKGVAPDIVFPSYSDAMDIGEDKLEHPMPWDSIQPVPDIKFCRNGVEQCVPKLKNECMDRIARSAEFKALVKDIGHYRELKKRKTISLNINTRWKEYLAEKKMTDEQTKLMKLDSDLVSSAEKKKNKTKDIYLTEAARIVGDFAAMTAQKVSK